MILNSKKYVIQAFVTMTLCGLCYLLGKADAEVRVIREKGEEIVKEVEVIKYVEREKSKIWRQPNAGRDDLLKLMQDNRL